jgi:hypothetical protein
MAVTEDISPSKVQNQWPAMSHDEQMMMMMVVVMMMIIFLNPNGAVFPSNKIKGYIKTLIALIWCPLKHSS